MPRPIDCLICGSCTIDILVRPFPLTRALGEERLLDVEPIDVVAGGIVSNAGIALARLGMKPSAFTYLGNDDWASWLCAKYQSEGLGVEGLVPHPTARTSTTVVLVDSHGQRSFAHSQGAPKLMDAGIFVEHMPLFVRSRMALIGYYPLMPYLQDDLPSVLARIRETGCQTALDAAGSGGDMEPLDRILPHLDLYVPSYAEAAHQTGRTNAKEMLRVFRNSGTTALLGVKLGAEGVLLSPADEEFIHVPAVPPPGPVLDTTGAGDTFYAGLIAGLLRSMSVEAAARLGAATAACCITEVGASAGLRDYDGTASLAGL